MGYLDCEKCGGYYKLKEGEAIDDFEGCSCGGKYKFVKEIEEIKSAKDLKSNFIENSTCPNCGIENSANTKFCGSCGKPLNTENITIKPQKKVTNTSSSNKSGFIAKNDIIAIISGLITIIALYSAYFLSIYIIPTLITGIVAGFFTPTGNYMKSILYGAITSFVGTVGYVLVINVLYSSYISFQYADITISPIFIVEIIIVAIALGAIGGLVGSFIRQRASIKN